jgi:hypothetical protein
MDFEKKTLPELKQMQLNYERLAKTETADYHTLVATIDRRGANGLDLERTIGFLRNAAAERRFVSAKDIAAASGVVWDNVVRLRMNAHLDEVTRHVARDGGPLLTSIVVSPANVATGKLEPVALRAFVKLVTELRGEPAERGPAANAAMLAQAQEDVFRWAEETNSKAA